MSDTHHRLPLSRDLVESEDEFQRARRKAWARHQSQYLSKLTPDQRRQLAGLQVKGYVLEIREWRGADARIVGAEMVMAIRKRRQSLIFAVFGGETYDEFLTRQHNPTLVQDEDDNDD